MPFSQSTFWPHLYNYWLIGFYQCQIFLFALTIFGLTFESYPNRDFYFSSIIQSDICYLSLFVVPFKEELGCSVQSTVIDEGLDLIFRCFNLVIRFDFVSFVFNFRCLVFFVPFQNFRVRIDNLKQKKNITIWKINLRMIFIIPKSQHLVDCICLDRPVTWAPFSLLKYNYNKSMVILLYYWSSLIFFFFSIILAFRCNVKSLMDKKD